jgi:hypothetical protein
MRRIWGGIGARLAAIGAQAASRWNDRIASWLLGGPASDETRAIQDATIINIVRRSLRSCLRSTGGAMRGSW